MQITRVARQLHKMSKVPRTSGALTKPMPLGGSVQLLANDIITASSGESRAMNANYGKTAEERQ